MLDCDLAEIYGYEVKALNQQVKRNIIRFPDDFMFQLTKEEVDFVKSQIVTSNGTKNLKSQIVTSSWGGTRKLPYVFTEQGIYMFNRSQRRACRTTEHFYYACVSGDASLHNAKPAVCDTVRDAARYGKSIGDKRAKCGYV